MFKSMKNFIKCVTSKRDDKIKYLKHRIFDYYYTVTLTQLSKGSVNLPEFIIRNQAKNYAESATHYNIQNVIEENRLNQCFAKALQ